MVIKVGDAVSFTTFARSNKLYNIRFILVYQHKTLKLFEMTMLIFTFFLSFMDYYHEFHSTSWLIKVNLSMFKSHLYIPDRLKIQVVSFTYLGTLVLFRSKNCGWWQLASIYGTRFGKNDMQEWSWIYWTAKCLWRHGEIWN